MKPRPLLLLAMLLTCGAATLRPADAPPAVRQLRIDPSTTKVVVGHARLSVDPLTRSGDGLSGTYKVEVSPFPIGNESGKLTVNVSGDDLRRLARGETIQFSGQAVNTQGNSSAVRGTATPAGNSGDGALRVHIASQKGKLVFDTSYHLDR